MSRLERCARTCRAAFWAVAALAALPSAASSDCLTDLIESIDGRSYEAQKAVVDELRGGDLRCLFRATRGHSFPDAVSYFVPVEHQLERRVAKFHGKNSLPLFNKFAKHFFLSEGGALLGYNDSEIARLIRSPGFFVAQRTVAGRLILDYRLDVRTHITAHEFWTWQGRTWWRLKSNDGDPLFGDLVDVMHRVTEDVAVGRGLRQTEGRWTHQAYFILLRQP